MGAGTSRSISRRRPTRRRCAGWLRRVTGAAADLRHDRAEGLGRGEPRRPQAGRSPAASRCTARTTAPRVAANRIGIEIEAALAFGTGHHGTTRGCLLALDRIAEGARAGDACGSSTSGPAPACSPSRPPRRCARRCSQATSIRRPCASRARMRASTAARALVECLHAAGLASTAVSRARAVRSGVRQYPAWAADAARRARCGALLAPGARVVLSGLLAAQENAALAAYRPHGLQARAAHSARRVGDAGAALTLIACCHAVASAAG